MTYQRYCQYSIHINGINIFTACPATRTAHFLWLSGTNTLCKTISTLEPENIYPLMMFFLHSFSTWLLYFHIIILLLSFSLCLLFFFKFILSLHLHLFTPSSEHRNNFLIIFNIYTHKNKHKKTSMRNLTEVMK